MNDLSELLVSSTTVTISAQPTKLTEQLLTSNTIHNEIEKQKDALQQLYSNAQEFKQTTSDSEDIDSVKGEINKYLFIFNFKKFLSSLIKSEYDRYITQIRISQIHLVYSTYEKE